MGTVFCEMLDCSPGGRELTVSPYGSTRRESVCRRRAEMRYTKLACRIEVGQFQRFCKVAGCEELSINPEYATNGARLKNREVLVPILRDYKLSEGAIHAVYPHARHVSTKVRAFTDFLAKRFGGKPYWDRDL